MTSRYTGISPLLAHRSVVVSVRLKDTFCQKLQGSRLSSKVADVTCITLDEINFLLVLVVVVFADYRHNGM